MMMAKNLAKTSPWLLVTAETQTGGRGTKGRVWQSPPGNLYFTLGLPASELGLRQAWFALEAGCALYTAVLQVASLVNKSDKSLLSLLKLKWPNDLLWGPGKAAGVLIENQEQRLYVGIGVNLEYSPPVIDGGRPAATLQAIGLDSSHAIPLAKTFSLNLQNRLSLPWTPELKTALVQEWSTYVNWDQPLKLRDREHGQEVWPLGLNEEGGLRVRNASGHEETLYADYLW